LPSLLAIFGGVARSCHFGVSSIRQFISSAVVSGFTGVVIHLLLQETELSTSVQAAIVATSGYSGGAILDAIQSRIIKAVHHLPGPGAECHEKHSGRNKERCE
jgi:ABC-type Mn2+/Zn2+ transport system permease subunit